MAVEAAVAFAFLGPSSGGVRCLAEQQSRRRSQVSALLDSDPRISPTGVDAAALTHVPLPMVPLGTWYLGGTSPRFWIQHSDKPFDATFYVIPASVVSRSPSGRVRLRASHPGGASQENRDRLPRPE